MLDVSLAPINFFQIKHECPRDLKPLPDTSSLCNEHPFATVSMGWSEAGITFHTTIKRPFQDEKRDKFEVFLDTRDVKTASFNTRFCHHFYCIAKPEEAGEITRFRTEDAHELCDPKLLKVKSELHKKKYEITLFIPSECLFGYDPQQFDRIGMSYRVSSSLGEAQHFSVISDEYNIEQQPSLWSSVKLV